MARVLTAAMLAAIRTGNLRPVLFYEGVFGSGTVRLFTGSGTLTWNGNTWTGDNGMLSIGSVGEGSDLTAIPQSVSLNGNVSSLLTLALSQVRRGLAGRIWLGLFHRDAYLTIPGVAGNRAGTPDTARVSVTGNLDVLGRAAADDWSGAAIQTLAAKYGAAGTRSWWVRLTTGGALQLVYTLDGTTALIAPNSGAVPFTNGAAGWWRVTKVASSGELKYYTAADQPHLPESWSQLGSTASVTAGAMFDSTADLTVGELQNNTSPLTGKVYYTELRADIDGPAIARFDAARFSGADLTMTAETGETWTITQTGGTPAQIVRVADALIEDPVLIFSGRADRPEITPDPAGASVGVNYESRFIDAARRRERRYTPEDQKIDYPADLGFDYVASLQDTVFTWGRG
jgi:hypothetical protein